MNNSLLINIAEFIDLLRVAGVKTGISETLDAFNSLLYVDLMNRDQVKAALAACLAKCEEDREIFLECFDRFFLPSQVKEEYIASKRKLAEETRKNIMEKASELKFKEHPLEVDDELKEVYATVTEEDRQRIREFLERTSNGLNVGDKFKALTQNIIQGKLNYLKGQYEKQMDVRSGWSVETSDAGLIAEAVGEAIRNENRIYYKNLGNISDDDLPEVIRLIRLLTDKFRKKSHINRLRHSRRLDLKKTISSNIANGGTLFQLRYKKKPGSRQRILLLCDVSSSMYRYSGFVIQFIAGMHAGANYVENYIFSQEVEHLNIHDQKVRMDIEQKVKQSRVWQRGTDLHQAIDHILHNRFLVMNSSTIVIIVSDGKTLNASKAAESLRILRTKVKSIYWFNPIQESDWTGISGLNAFQKHCRMFDCSTLERLNNACMNKM